MTKLFGEVKQNPVSESEDLLIYITSNQRLEFLGDAILEVLVTQHLFHVVILRTIPYSLFIGGQFPHHREGRLTLYRSALVNNIYLAHLAVEKLRFHEYFFAVDPQALVCLVNVP